MVVSQKKLCSPTLHYCNLGALPIPHFTLLFSPNRPTLLGAYLLTALAECHHPCLLSDSDHDDAVDESPISTLGASSRGIETAALELIAQGHQTTISPELRRLGRAGLGSSVNAKKKYKPGAILGGSATCRVCTVIYSRYLVRRR